MSIYVPKRTLESNEKYGVFLWRLPDGSYIKNGQDYLVCGPCTKDNKTAMKNMRAAARSLGATEGQPFWLPGFRIVSDMEWEDQMERLIEGKVPDLVDLYYQTEEKRD